MAADVPYGATDHRGGLGDDRGGGRPGRRDGPGRRRRRGRRASRRGASWRGERCSPATDVTSAGVVGHGQVLVPLPLPVERVPAGGPDRRRSRAGRGCAGRRVPTRWTGRRDRSLQGGACRGTGHQRPGGRGCGGGGRGRAGVGDSRCNRTVRPGRPACAGVEVSVVVVCSAHGAPGVTTTALALTWMWPAVHPDRKVLLLDADPAGSGLLTGYLRAGVPDSAGVLALAAQRPPLSAEQTIECALALDADSTRMLLPGVSDPVQARPLGRDLDRVGGHSDASWVGIGVDVVVDAGRLGHRYEPTSLLHAADVVAVMARSEIASLVPAAAAVRRLRDERPGRIRAGGPGGRGRVLPRRDHHDASASSDALPVALDAWTAGRFDRGRRPGLAIRAVPAAAHRPCRDRAPRPARPDPDLAVSSMTGLTRPRRAIERVRSRRVRTSTQRRRARAARRRM